MRNKAANATHNSDVVVLFRLCFKTDSCTLGSYLGLETVSPVLGSVTLPVSSCAYINLLRSNLGLLMTLTLRVCTSCMGEMPRHLFWMSIAMESGISFSTNSLIVPLLTSRVMISVILARILPIWVDWA